MPDSIPPLSIIFMVIACLAGFAIPIVLFLYFQLKKHADAAPFFVGCGVMLIFALILEAGVHQIVLGSPVGETIRGNIWSYALYGGLMAGLFEETGRFIAFKTLLRKEQKNDINALMYGAGHGGFEAMVVLGISMLSNISLAIMLNSGNSSSVTGPLLGDSLSQLQNALGTLASTPSYVFLMGIVERIFAVLLQIALSVLVWFAAKRRDRFYLYPVAILIHFIVDAFTVVLSQYGVPILAVEAAIGVLTVLAGLYARRTWFNEFKDGSFSH